MTDEAKRLAEIRARAEKATPGPWKWHTSNSWRRLKRDDRGISQSVSEPFVARDGHPDLDINEPDMQFIAHARTDIPFLLAEIERLRAQVRRYAERLEIDHVFKLQNKELVRVDVPKADWDKQIDGISCRDETIKLQDDEIRCLTAARDAAWQPIGTAPKDGTFVLIYDGTLSEPTIAMASYRGGGWFGVDQYGLTYDKAGYRLDATHWMPLPAPLSAIRSLPLDKGE